MPFNNTGAGTSLLASSIGSSDTTILLSSFIEPVSGTPYTMALINSDICYATLAPKTANTEFISFTGIVQNIGGTATLTGVTRGLSRSSPFTSSASFKLPHSSQTQLILSNSPQQINEYVTIRNNETISGVKTFSSFPLTPSSAPTTDYQVSNRKFVTDSIAAGGAPASTTVAGLSMEATQAQEDTRTPTNVYNAVTYRLFSNPSTIRAGKYHDYVADTGIADAYAIAPTPAVTAYTPGQVFTFKAKNANTGASTLNVAGLGTMAIKKLDTNTALVAGDIAAGEIVMVSTDGTVAALVSPVANAPIPLSYLDTSISLGTSDTKVPSQNAINSAISHKNGTTTKDISDASVAQTIAHGLGRLPRKVRIIAKQIISAAAATVAVSETVYNGTTQSSQSVWNDVGGAPWVCDNTFTLNATGPSGKQVGVVTFDATNITITWTKTSSPTGTYQIMWEAQ